MLAYIVIVQQMYNIIETNGLCLECMTWRIVATVCVCSQHRHEHEAGLVILTASFDGDLTGIQLTWLLHSLSQSTNFGKNIFMPGKLCSRLKYVSQIKKGQRKGVIVERDKPCK